MQKASKLATAIAFAFAASTAATGALAQAQSVDNWQSGYGQVWKNGTNELCWRDAFWTPATAHPDCDGAIKPVAAPAPAPAAAPAPPPPPPPPPPAPVSEKVTFAADTFFDFNKSVLKPDAKTKLDDLVSKIQGINLEVVIAVGHTDSVGSDAYNQKLSVRRSEAVKAYLVSKGIEANRVYTEGKGEKQPIAPNKLANGKDNPEGRAKNRRVEIEVVGTRKK